MIKYFISKCYLLGITIILILFALFLMSYYFPVPHYISLTGIVDPTSNQLIEMKKQYLIGTGFFSEFLAFVNLRLNGEMGVSMTSQSDIALEIAKVIPASIELGLCALFLALILGVPLGIIAALSRHKWFQQSTTFFTIGIYSIPIFWFGILLSLVFGIYTDLLPTSGRINLLYDIPEETGLLLVDILFSSVPNQEEAFLNALQHIILPACVLSMYPFTIMARVTFTSMQEILNTNYIKATQARGLSTFKIIFKHALPNAILPIIRQFSLMLSGFFTYGIINEVVFSWPGIGHWLILGIYQRDYTVIQNGILVISLFIVCTSFAVNMIYMLTNPLSRKELYGSH